MPAFEIPVPICKSVLDARTGKTIGVMTTHDTPVEIEKLTDTDVPVALAWTEANVKFDIRRQNATGQFWYREQQRLQQRYSSVKNIYRGNLFELIALCGTLTEIFEEWNGGAEVDIIPQWRLPQPSRRERKLQTSDLSQSHQHDAILSHLSKYRIIDGAIYRSIPEPVAFVSASNPTPLPATIEDRSEFYDTLMVYSMRDWHLAQSLIDRIGEPSLYRPQYIELDFLDPDVFGPPDEGYRKAIFLREFSMSYHEHLSAVEEDFAGTVASFTEADKSWLGKCADCLEDIERGVFDIQALDTTVGDLLSGNVGPVLGSMLSSWRRFSLVCDALRAELKMTARVG